MTQPVEAPEKGPENPTPDLSSFEPRGAPIRWDIPWSDSEPTAPASDALDATTAEQVAAAKELGITPRVTPSPSPPQEPEPAAQAEPPSQPAPSEPAGEAAPPRTLSTSDLRTAEWSDDEVEELAKNPALQARIERLAANRAGNLMREQRERDANWAERTAAYERYVALLDSNDPGEREQYRALSRDPEVAAFVARYQQDLAARERPQAADGANQQELLTQFNDAAVVEYVEGLKAHLPWWSELPAQFRRKLEGAQQESTSDNWLVEYTRGLAEESAKYWNKRVQAEVDAAKKQWELDRGTTNPPRVASPEPSQSLTPDEVIFRHAMFGFDESNGVTNEQLQRAKKAKGLEY